MRPHIVYSHCDRIRTSFKWPDSVSSTVSVCCDCLVYREVGSIDDQLALQRDLDLGAPHMVVTILTISRSPPLHKFYSLCGTILQQVSEAKYLGVNISEDLHWSKHIQSLRQAHPFLRRNLSLGPQNCVNKPGYISYQVSTGVLCSNLGSASREGHPAIGAIQRRAARFVVKTSVVTPVWNRT